MTCCICSGAVGRVPPRYTYRNSLMMGSSVDGEDTVRRFGTAAADNFSRCCAASAPRHLLQSRLAGIPPATPQRLEQGRGIGEPPCLCLRKVEHGLLIR